MDRFWTIEYHTSIKTRAICNNINASLNAKQKKQDPQEYK